MRRIGHRGAKGHAPENTIAAFQKAIDLGCDEIETDVWLLGGSDALVISHDRPAASGDLLTLDETLDFCRGRIAVNVELKSAITEGQARSTGMRVAQRLAERGEPDAYVSSFWWSALEAARSAAPDVRRAFIYGASPDQTALFAGARELGLWALHPQLPYVTPDLVRRAHAASLAVNVWTVNDPRDIARLAEWGVDGIMSDYPERVPR